MAGTEFYTGRRSKGFCYAVEPSYGTVNTATTWAWPGYVEEFNGDDDKQLMEISPMDGEDTRFVDEYIEQVPSYGGNLIMKMQHLRFLAVLGLGTDTVTETNLHTITPTVELPSFSFQVGHLHTTNPFTTQYTGAKIKKWGIQWPKGEFILQNFDIVAQNVVKVASTGKGYQTTATPLKKYTQTQMPNRRSSGGIFIVNSIDIAPYVTSASFSCDNNLSIEPSLDADVGDLISEPICQTPTVEASLTVRMKESDLWDLWKSGTNCGACTFGSQRSATDYFKINFSNAKMSKANKPIKIKEGVVIQDLNFKIPNFVLTEKNSIVTDYDAVCA
jgi:hypothetical protein